MNGDRLLSRENMSRVFPIYAEITSPRQSIAASALVRPPVMFIDAPPMAIDDILLSSITPEPMTSFQSVESYFER